MLPPMKLLTESKDMTLSMTQLFHKFQLIKSLKALEHRGCLKSGMRTIQILAIMQALNELSMSDISSIKLSKD